IRERKLGYLALLRNLGNMDNADVDQSLVEEAILDRRGAGKILPFRYVAAARAAPRFEQALEKAMLADLAQGSHASPCNKARSCASRHGRSMPSTGSASLLAGEDLPQAGGGFPAQGGWYSRPHHRRD